MSKKNNKPLTTSFIRELSRLSPMEEHGRMLQKFGEQDEYARFVSLGKLHGGDSSERIYDEITQRGVEKFFAGIHAYSPNSPLMRASFSAWLCSVVRAILEAGSDLAPEVSRIFVGNTAYSIVMNSPAAKGKSEEEIILLTRAIGDTINDEMQVHKDYLLWERYHKPTYTYSPDLAQMFLHTRLDTFPIEQLKLPHPAVEFVFPPGLFEDFDMPQRNSSGHTRMAVVGALVTNEQAWHTSTPNIRIVVWGKTAEKPLMMMHLVTFETAIAGSVSERLDKLMAHHGHEELDAGVVKEATALIPKIVNFIVASIIYSTMSNADIILGQDSPEYCEWVEQMASRRLNRHQLKDVAGIQQAVNRVNRYYLGRAVRIVDRHSPAVSDGPEGTHASPRMHIRSGHYHHYWTGPKAGPQVLTYKYVEPVWINVPDGEVPPDIGRAGMR